MELVHGVGIEFNRTDEITVTIRLLCALFKLIRYLERRYRALDADLSRLKSPTSHLRMLRPVARQAPRCGSASAKATHCRAIRMVVSVAIALQVSHHRSSRAIYIDICTFSVLINGIINAEKSVPSSQLTYQIGIGCRVNQF